jgi:hypothetical protein
METVTQSIEIAKEILNQIKCLDRWALGAWGAANCLALSESKKYQGGLRFNVSGIRHKGAVLIQLRWVDDYTVSFVNNKGAEVHRVEGVYCDMLVDIIDWIEGK